MNQTCIKITIVVRGESEGDINEAANEALRSALDDNICGHNSNDSGAYYFEVEKDVPQGDWPA